MSIIFDFLNDLIVQREQLRQSGLRLRQRGGVLRPQKIAQRGKWTIQRDNAELRGDAFERMGEEKRLRHVAADERVTQPGHVCVV